MAAPMYRDKACEISCDQTAEVSPWIRLGDNTEKCRAAKGRGQGTERGRKKERREKRGGERRNRETGIGEGRLIDNQTDRQKQRDRDGEREVVDCFSSHSVHILLNRYDCSLNPT